jgi:FdhD protein
MRTPGNDRELAMGFLYTEGIVYSKADILDVVQVNENVVLVSLAVGREVQIGKMERNFYTTSSCGVCGKASIDAIKTVCQMEERYPYDQLKVSPEVIYGLPHTVSGQQGLFAQTGGIHASALFDLGGQLLWLREDVGRHNAMDKLVGKSLAEGLLPLENHILFLSGRASFELVQKAAMAGIKIIVAVGAPSSLAVQMAEEWNMTLIGFLRGEKFNIYCGVQRVVM